MLKTLEMILREPLWNLDETVLREILLSFLSMDSVVYLQVNDTPNDFKIDVGDQSYKQEQNLMTIDKVIQYDEKQIGELIVCFTENPLGEDIQKKFLRLLGLIFSLFILIVILITISSKQYVEPLTSLAKTIKKFDIRDPERYSVLQDEEEVKEVQEVIDSYRMMAEEITANYEELEATNEMLMEMNDKLEKKSVENKKLAGKLSKIIEISSQFEETTHIENGYFMKKLFENAFQIILEADYGTVYLYRNNNVVFIDSVGHDLKLLQETLIPRDIFITHSSKIGVKKNIQEFTTVNLPKRTFKQKKI